MRRKSFLIGLIFLWCCLACVANRAQAKSADEIKRQAEKVEAFVREKMAANHIPGLSLAVLREGKIVLVKGFGTANLELNSPVSEKTAFAIYSITKTFTGVATMMLVEEGKISLEDKISKHLADLPAAWQNVTIRQLLNHTSGIPNWRDYSAQIGSMESSYTKAEVLKPLKDLPLVFPSGENWAYCETNFFLLGMLIEKISGKTYEQFLRERIFAPLEMRDTRMDSAVEIIANRADGYEWKNNTYQNAVWYNPTLTFSTAGLVSNVLDLAKWDAALYTEKLLKKRTLDQMWTNARLNNGTVVPDYGLAFGMSPFRGHKRVGHVGGAEGFATAISRFIDDKVTVIVLSNAGQEGFAISEIANEIASFYFSF